MLKIDRKAKTFSTLSAPSLADAAISERYDLQEYICNAPGPFFAELGRRLFYLAKEVVPSDDVQDRIDILAVDKYAEVGQQTPLVRIIACLSAVSMRF